MRALGGEERPSFFYGKFMVKKVLGEVHSGGVYWGREAKDALRGENEADGETSDQIDGTVGRAVRGSVSAV
jgi:hypothetical protein